MIQLLFGMQSKLVSYIHVLGALEHLGINHVTDNGLILAGQVFIQKFRQAIPGNCFFVVCRFRLGHFVFSCEVEELLPSYPTTFCSKGTIPAIFFSSSSGTLWRCMRYSGLL